MTEQQNTFGTNKCRKSTLQDDHYEMLYTNIYNVVVIKASLRISEWIYFEDFTKICCFIEAKYNQVQIIDNEIILILKTAEDKRFFTHCGFDILAIFRAIFYSIFKNIRSGASTIDQQLVRTITGEKDITIKRKIKEIILATAINYKFEKYTIANAYLNCAYFGWNMHGIEDAYIRIMRDETINKCHIKYALISFLKYPLPRHPSKAALTKIYNRIRYIKDRVEKLPQNEVRK